MIFVVLGIAGSALWVTAFVAWISERLDNKKRQ